MKCKKSYCMKQMNPLIPNIYFGKPFEKDEDSGACRLCDMGLGASYVYGEPLEKERSEE